MRRPAAFALAALLLASSPALADYTFDPADLPKGFECAPVKDAPNGADSTGEADCPRERREEAWWNRHGEAYDRWFHELAFNPDLYFADEPPDPRDRASHAETPNLVDAVYAIALQRYGGWAFAVDMACAEVPAGKRVDKASCAPKLRMVSMRRGEEIDPVTQGRLADVMPTTRQEVAAQLVVTARWEEADLRTCKGAMGQLLALPAQRGEPLWHPGYVKWLRGQPPAETDDLQITLDGAGLRTWHGPFRIPLLDEVGGAFVPLHELVRFEVHRFQRVRIGAGNTIRTEEVFYLVAVHTADRVTRLTQSTRHPESYDWLAAYLQEYLDHVIARSASTPR